MADLNTLLRFLRIKTSIPKEESAKETYDEIVEGSFLHGHNFWILGFAMVIACIGINTDSVATIIGAMLISPLMGPVTAFAFGISINDKGLRAKSLSNWVFMTVISLISSTLFFLLSPFDNNTSVLLSFTRGNIFDILVAFFGGMAGFIGIMKKDGIKVLAGVAVATACMPPLCTAGFGLAHGDMAIFLGGLYFYLINCLFIGIATFIVSRVTGYHIIFHAHLNKNWVSRLFWISITIAMLVPGVYLFIDKWKAEKKNINTPTQSLETRIQQLEAQVHTLDSTVMEYKKVQ